MPNPSKGSLTTDFRIQVTWSELVGTSTGNSNILGYNLYWDNGSGEIDL